MTDKQRTKSSQSQRVVLKPAPPDTDSQNCWRDTDKENDVNNRESVFIFVFRVTGKRLFGTVCDFLNNTRKSGVTVVRPLPLYLLLIAHAEMICSNYTVHCMLT